MSLMIRINDIPGWNLRSENRRFAPFLQAIQLNSAQQYISYAIAYCFYILAISFLTNRPIIRRYVNWANGSVLK